MGWAVQDPQPALAAGQDPEELHSTVVPFSLDKRSEGRRLIYSSRYSIAQRSTALCARCIVCAGIPALEARQSGQIDGQRFCYEYLHHPDGLGVNFAMALCCQVCAHVWLRGGSAAGVVG